MRFLTDAERQTLTAFCDTIHPRQADEPSAPICQSASELGVIALVERALADRDEMVQRSLRRLLRLLESPAINGMLAGHWSSFSRLTEPQRTDVLLAMANSQFNGLRGAFHGVKQLVSFLAYASEPQPTGNPFWQAYEYQGHATRCPPQPRDQLPIYPIHRSQTLTCDVLVVGSGAGGGVVAAELAAAGQDVIVAEKGAYFANDRLPDTELDGMRLLYEGRGALRTADRGMVVLAGSTLGGGTTVNWMTCLEPPPSLLEQWAREHGFAAATSREYAASVDSVARRIHVTTAESHANFQNAALERGCRELGYQTSVIGRNVHGCVRCDFCSFGCRHGAKQDTRRTFLRDATDHQTRIIVQADVRRILHRHGSVVGAEMVVTDDAEQRHTVRVQCKYVVSAAGAIHTPALLLRSGLTNRNIGGNLQLHPVGAVFAKYAEPVQAWKGAPQTRLCEHFADLDGQGYGVRLEASPAHPGLWALGLPWQGGMPFQELMRQVPHLANTIVLTRDKFTGRVTTDGHGQPVLQYKLHPYDAEHLMFGLLQAIRVHRAAGAEVVYGPHNDCLSFDCADSAKAFEDYLSRVQQSGVRPNHLGLFCAHQMSSCRMGGSAAKGALQPTGESYECQNLYVADGSALPTSTGVNPMLTIFATAHHIAQQLKARL